ncbi:MAG: hypothetical protein J6J60_05035 [Clostridia bacterium]|nr:hypothetical protein [Clostridia bacterium]
MKKNLNPELENNEEVKKVKKQYKKIIKISLIILVICLGLFLINFIKTYLTFSKIMKSNIAINLGDNYKITTYEVGVPVYVYFKDNVKKTVRNEGKDNEFIIYQTEDKTYGITPKTKRYFDIELRRGVNEIDLISSMMWDKEYLDFKNFVRVMFTESVRIGKEEYNGKDYITLTIGMIKLWVNPETYYVEKELRYGDETLRIIEKDVVKDGDIEIPNLEEYGKDFYPMQLTR